MYPLIRAALLPVVIVAMYGCSSQPPLAVSLSPQTEASQPVKALTNAQSQDLRVMTFNLRVRTLFDGPNIWDARRQNVVERVREFDPDLLGTQEGLAGQTDYLRTKLPDYGFVGVGRDDGGRFGEMCGVFYRASRFDLLESGHFWLSEKPENPGSHGWGAMFPRMVTWVKLRPRDGGDTFCWFNTHFDAWNSRARLQSARLLRQRMNSIAPNLPCVVTGDFNADEDTDCYRAMLIPESRLQQPLMDSYRVANRIRTDDEGTRHDFSGRKSGERIDWILATSQFTVIDADIVHTRGRRGFPSDHFPVTATLRPSLSAHVPVVAAE